MPKSYLTKLINELALMLDKSVEEVKDAVRQSTTIGEDGSVNLNLNGIEPLLGLPNGFFREAAGR